MDKNSKGENEDQRFRNAGDVFTRYPRPESSSGRYTKEELKALFPNAFSGKPGCVKGVKVHLDIDPAVKPVRQKLRPVPFHLREAISKEIKKQVEMGILERVEDDMKAPEWVANIVPVLKEKEVKMGRDHRMAKEKPEEVAPPEKRITVDNRCQNKAIKRMMYPGKTQVGLQQGVPSVRAGGGTAEHGGNNDA